MATKQYKKLFELDDVELEFEDEALEVIAKKSFERKTGARGLRSICEKIMMDVMYDIPTDLRVSKVIITKEAALGEAKPRVVLLPEGEERKSMKGKPVKKSKSVIA